jgi:dephospho-CoA kinase|tara:strand:- start:21086 stop:21742 length:657 start_codon:yes stop_codon:yes gene_type:complete
MQANLTTYLCASFHQRGSPLAERIKTFGLTGGIASGKSSALDVFKTLGITTLDTDYLARTVIAPGTEGVRVLQTAIGGEFFLDEKLDRSILRDKMYADPHLRSQVESVIHPLVFAEVKLWLSAKISSPYRILCSPLLFEKKQDQNLDGVIVITLNAAEQLKRAQLRDHKSLDQIKAVMAAQMPEKKRVEQALYLINNNGNEDALKSQIELLHHRLLHD